MLAGLVDLRGQFRQGFGGQIVEIATGRAEIRFICIAAATEISGGGLATEGDPDFDRSPGPNVASVQPAEDFIFAFAIFGIVARGAGIPAHTLPVLRG